MGLFDTLFKSKSKKQNLAKAEIKPSCEVPVPRVVATSGTGPSVPREARAAQIPPKPVSGAALQMPTPVLPRSLTQRAVQHAPALPAPNASGAQEPSRDERTIALTLADVLAGIRPELLKAVPMDPARAFHFPLANLTSELSRGRAAIPLVDIIQQCPEYFADAAKPMDGEMVRLPLQKLLEQISSTRKVPAQSPQPALHAPELKPVGVVAEAPLEAEIATVSVPAVVELTPEILPAAEVSTPIEPPTATDIPELVADEMEPILVEPQLEKEEGDPVEDSPAAPKSSLPVPPPVLIFARPAEGNAHVPDSDAAREPEVVVEVSIDRGPEPQAGNLPADAPRESARPPLSHGVPSFPLRPPRGAAKPKAPGAASTQRIVPPSSPILPARPVEPPASPVAAKQPQLFGANPLDRYFSTKTAVPVNWSAVGVLLGVSGEVTLSQVAQAIVQLPDVKACLLVVPPNLAVGGKWPASMQVDNHMPFARRLTPLIPNKGGSALSQTRIVTESGALLVFGIENVMVCVLIKGLEPSPEVREKLSVVSKALAHARQGSERRGPDGAVAD